MGTAGTILLTILLTIIIYSVVLFITARLLIPKLSGHYLFYIPLFKFTATERRYYVARQLGLEIDDVQFVGKDMYYDRVNDKSYKVQPYMGIQLLTEEGQFVDEYLFNSNAGYISEEIKKWQSGGFEDEQNYEDGQVEAAEDDLEVVELTQTEQELTKAETDEQ